MFVQETVLQKPTGGVPRRDDGRHPDRDRPSATSLLSRLGLRAAQAVRTRLRAGAEASTTRVTRAMRSHATAERTLPVAVASIVAIAALLGFLPSTPQGAVGGIQGRGTDIRLAVNGGIELKRDDEQTADSGAADLTGRAGLEAPAPSFQPVTLPSEITNEPESEQATLEAPVLDDGTLVTGYAPLTTVEDGADLIRTYKVRSGDSLASIAKHFHVSLMTLWWANKLKSTTDLHKGQTLRIPPVSGLVYTVKDTDTLETLAKTYKVSGSKIVKLNGLDDPTLVVGQVLVLPGAKGAPLPTPKPITKPSPTRSGVTSGVGAGIGGEYTGGAFRWPVVGGGNYISQYFHYGHWAIDIAADFGSKVVAASGGKVIFAGWKSNGGGWQVWISHGGGLYTTYNHMSALSVANGATVAKGTQVGRVGQSGNATGPHLHFEVWKGPIWDGGTRMNPLHYY
jgi:murein DD-endopeptidase MepM/ murein hydrolase activator NlpD